MLNSKIIYKIVTICTLFFIIILVPYSCKGDINNDNLKPINIQYDFYNAVCTENKNGLPLYDNPESRRKKIGTIPELGFVDYEGIYKQNNGKLWLLVSYDKLTGWVSASYLYPYIEIENSVDWISSEISIDTDRYFITQSGRGFEREGRSIVFESGGKEEIIYTSDLMLFMSLFKMKRGKYLFVNEMSSATAGSSKFLVIDINGNKLIFTYDGQLLKYDHKNNVLYLVKFPRGEAEEPTDCIKVKFEDVIKKIK